MEAMPTTRVWVKVGQGSVPSVPPGKLLRGLGIRGRGGGSVSKALTSQA